MPSYLLESGRLFLNSAPRGAVAPVDFVALASVDAELTLNLAAQFPTTLGTPNDVLAGFRGDVVITASSQAAALQGAVDRLTSALRAVAPAGRIVQLDPTSSAHWIRISPQVHQIIGYVYDNAGGQLEHWSYDHATKPFRGYLSFSFSLREVSIIP